nr:MAG: baculoviral IAP repeat-containing protein [Penaeus semisulcatus pemonivirus]
MSESCSSLHDEQARYDTFNGHEFSVDSKLLAKVGFYYSAIGDVKCYSCKLKVDVKAVNESSIMAIHKEKSPKCTFVQRFTRPRINKKFSSYDSLRFETARLETFIDWPVKWLHPSELAADGFYYLRTADHCACIFCRGIVGKWEPGDTPRREHHLHFPHCPFIRGQPVGNVPISLGNISSSRLSQENTPYDINQDVNIDICGTPMEASLVGIGLPQYHGPKRQDYVTIECRLKSFDKWPGGVTQIPQDLVEAGFFYCGLSDHVRCFHCGNGIRNWERDDIPWNEHARLYPKCNYVRLMKGQSFIDEIQREENSHQTTTDSPTLPARNEVNCLYPKDAENKIETQKASKKDNEEIKVSGAEVKGACETACSGSSSSLSNSNKITVERKDTEEKIQAMTSEGERHSSSPLNNSNKVTVDGNDTEEKKQALISEGETHSSSSQSNANKVNVEGMDTEEINQAMTPKGEGQDAYVSSIQFSKDEFGKKCDRMICKVCMDAEMNVVFLPCVHMVTCNSCAVALRKCPVCRKDIKHVIKPIIS